MGCTKVSPACDGCYAEAMMDKHYHKVEWGPHATRVRTRQENWNEPLRWQRRAELDGDRPFVFCASLGDIFDNQVEPAWRRDAFDVMRHTPNLVYLLLTKRPGNIVRMADAAGGLPANAALGTSVEDQPRADKNVPALLTAKVELAPLFAFLSCEPLLGLTKIPMIELVDWVIAGGETSQIGHQARPTHPDWFRELRDQCAAAGKPFHFKQWGEWTPGENVPHTVRGRRASAHWFADEWSIGSTNMNDPEDGWMDEPDVYRIGKANTGRMLDGVEHNAFPAVAPL
jgi:protein gp37